MIRSELLKKVLAPPVRRTYKLLNFKVLVYEGVFDPLLSVSGYLLARACSTLRPSNGSAAAEPFCGAGLTALTLARLGFFVVASDLDVKAALNAKLNAKVNGLDHLVDVVVADKLSHLRPRSVDVVAMNPPYLPVPRRSIHDPVGAGRGLQVLVEALKQALTKAKRYVITACDYKLPGVLLRSLGPVKVWLLKAPEA